MFPSTGMGGAKGLEGDFLSSIIPRVSRSWIRSARERGAMERHNLTHGLAPIGNDDFHSGGLCKGDFGIDVTLFGFLVLFLLHLGFCSIPYLPGSIWISTGGSIYTGSKNLDNGCFLQYIFLILFLKKCGASLIGFSIPEDLGYETLKIQGLY